MSQATDSNQAVDADSNYVVDADSKYSTAPDSPSEQIAAAIRGKLQRAES